MCDGRFSTNGRRWKSINSDIFSVGWPYADTISDLTKKTFLPVSQHFVLPGHSLEDFGRSKINIIDHNLSWKENQRHTRESVWIREIQTWHPKGKNKKAKIFCVFFSYCLWISVHIYLNNIKYKVQGYDLRHDNSWSRENFSNPNTDTGEACRSSEISVNLMIIIVFL